MSNDREVGKKSFSQMRARKSALNIQKYTCTVYRVSRSVADTMRDSHRGPAHLRPVQLEDSPGMLLDSSDKFERPFPEIDFSNKNLRI